MQSWPPAINFAHLLGGRWAISESISETEGKMIIQPPVPDRGAITCTLPAYQSFFPTLFQLGLVPIGVETVHTPEQANGHYLPNWTSVNANNKKNNEATTNTWRKLVHAAHKKNDFKCVDIASRISFQLRTIDERLKQISLCYRRELNALVGLNGFNPDCAHESMNTFHIGLSVHSFLSDSCILRDYLAEYLCMYKYHPDKRVTVHSKILGLVKKDAENDPFSAWIHSASDSKSNGWLAELGAYRDLVTHSVPLTYAEKKSWVFQRYEELSTGKLPMIFWPLPNNPLEIIKVRSSNGQDSSYEDYWSRLYPQNINIDEIFKQKDALEYCWKTIGNLFDYAESCLKLAPYKPMGIHIPAEDILEFKIHRQE